MESNGRNERNAQREINPAAVAAINYVDETC